MREPEGDRKALTEAAYRDLNITFAEPPEDEVVQLTGIANAWV